MSPELEAEVWRFVELVARGNTEFSELEARAEELLEMKCQGLQSEEGLCQELMAALEGILAKRSPSPDAWERAEAAIRKAKGESL